MLYRLLIEFWASIRHEHLSDINYEIETSIKNHSIILVEAHLSLHYLHLGIGHVSLFMSATEKM